MSPPSQPPPAEAPPAHAGPWSAAARSVLDARTEALARPVESGLSEALLLEVLRFRVAGEPYAVDARAVLAVAALTTLTRLPHAGPALAGLTSRDGAVLPVFHLRAVLGLPLAALPEHPRVVLFGTPADAVAFVVDRVERVDAVDLRTFREPPVSLRPVTRALLRGVSIEGSALIDHEALMGHEMLVIDAPVPTASSPPRR